MPTPSEKIRDKWLKTLLPLVPSEGWTRAAAAKAAREAGLDEPQQALAAPNGVTDLMDHFFEQAADQMLVALASEDLDRLRRHERVGAGLLTWLDMLEPNKAAVRKAAGRGLAPWGAGAAARRVWAIADTIWEAAGDTATDYNRQTKRMLLSAVIPPVVLKWLSTDDREALERFIERRLQRAMKMGQAGGTVLGPLLDAVERMKAQRGGA